jgi:glycosyltransferase involved in cell wall biosynthesis
MLVAPPPMEKILGSVFRKSRFGVTGDVFETFRVKSLGFLNSGSNSFDTLVPKGGSNKGLRRGSPSGNSDKRASFRLLIYGRVAKMKGAETVAYSAAMIQSLLPPSLKLHLIFAGIDWLHPKHRKPTSDTVRNITLKGFNGTIEFLGDVPRSFLQELSDTVHGGVLASEFETFGLAAHELAALGVPLIVSNIPDFFLPVFLQPMHFYYLLLLKDSSISDVMQMQKWMHKDKSQSRYL